MDGGVKDEGWGGVGGGARVYRKTYSSEAIIFLRSKATLFVALRSDYLTPNVAIIRRRAAHTMYPQCARGNIEQVVEKVPAQVPRRSGQSLRCLEQ